MGCPSAFLDWVHFHVQRVCQSMCKCTERSASLACGALRLQRFGSAWVLVATARRRQKDACMPKDAHGIAVAAQWNPERASRSKDDAEYSRQVSESGPATRSPAACGKQASLSPSLLILREAHKHSRRSLLFVSCSIRILLSR